MLKLNNPDLLKSKCLVGGVSVGDAQNGAVNGTTNSDAWIDSNKDNNRTIDVVNPFNGEVIGQVPNLSKDQVEYAVTVADAIQPVWAAKTADERASILDKWADLIDDNLEDLAVLMTTEMGKAIKESRGEITYANSFIRWFAQEGKRVYGDTIPAPKTDQRIVVIKQPVGVCAAITPWNFPAAMITRKVAPALASGCSIIVKPAGATPLSALALGELALQAGLPKGVLQIVTGDASSVGGVLTQDKRIRKLSFTGSTQVGRSLMADCADTIKNLSMELGGNAPFIVFEDADLEAAAQGLIDCKYRNAGQTCVCANRVFVQDTIKEKFLDIYIDKVAKLKVGNGLDNEVDIGPLINKDGMDKVITLLQDALDKGANLLIGGDKNDASDLTFNPTVIDSVDERMDMAEQEIFGPVTAIYTFNDEDEVIKRANNTIYGLAAYFYTQDLARSWRVSERLEYGIVGQNTGLISTAVAPFGGVKQSGFGREGSKYGIEEYIEIKYWCQDIG